MPVPVAKACTRKKNWKPHICGRVKNERSLNPMWSLRVIVPQGGGVGARIGVEVVEISCVVGFRALCLHEKCLQGSSLMHSEMQVARLPPRYDVTARWETERPRRVRWRRSGPPPPHDTPTASDASGMVLSRACTARSIETPRWVSVWVSKWVSMCVSVCVWYVCAHACERTFLELNF